MPILRFIDPLHYKYRNNKNLSLLQYLDTGSNEIMQEFGASQIMYVDIQTLCPNVWAGTSILDQFYSSIRKDPRIQNGEVFIIGPMQADALLQFKGPFYDQINKSTEIIMQAAKKANIMVIQFLIGVHLIVAEVELQKALKTNTYEIKIADSLDYDSQRQPKFNNGDKIRWQQTMEEKGLIALLNTMEPSYNIQIEHAANITLQTDGFEFGIHGA